MASIPICPTASTPPLVKRDADRSLKDGDTVPDIFDRQWWLYLKGLGTALNININEGNNFVTINGTQVFY